MKHLSQDTQLKVTFGDCQGNQLEKSHLPNVIQDLDPGNTKNKEGVMENIVTDAKKENKSDVLPTLPKE